MNAASGPQVWCIDVRAAGAALLALEAETPRLSDEDVARADRIADTAARREWMAAHVALRLVLERELGRALRRTPFVREAAGRPSLPRSDVAFSLAHAAGHALIATAPSLPLGVDLEGDRPVRLSAERRSAIEQAAATLTSAPLPAAGAPRFLQSWVRLEALAKADGEGLARILARTGAYGAGRRHGTDPSGLLPPSIRIEDLALANGLYAAIAIAAAFSPPQALWMPAGLAALRAFADASEAVPDAAGPHGR